MKGRESSAFADWIPQFALSTFCAACEETVQPCLEGVSRWAQPELGAFRWRFLLFA